MSNSNSILTVKMHFKLSQVSEVYVAVARDSTEVNSSEIVEGTCLIYHRPQFVYPHTTYSPQVLPTITSEEFKILKKKD